ncbi:MAG TPA: S41 family peptidase [Candidatus Saccharimonadales bacterium]|nr:S41 family peptidase [Candidatus Saccharimonadales bacterium]
MEPEEHYVETGRHRRWPLRKIVGVLIVVLVVFAAGMAVGRGNVRFWQSKKALAGTNSPLDYSSVSQVYNILKNNFDGSLDKNKLLDGLKTGLVNAAGDPYTEYFSAKDAKAFNNELAGSITGIGAELGTNDQDNIVIISPLSGYPAQKAGLKPKDIIAAINGKTTQGMSIDEAVSKIRGDVGTKVTLTIVRGSARPMDITITRQKITIPSVTSKIEGDIGYLKISQFTNDTVSLAQKDAKEFKKSHVKGVILDLRGDPGGYLDAAVGVSSLWLDEGQTVVQERKGSTVVDTKYANGDDILKGLPTVVLIDGGSASASEITAGALHDNGDATLVGVTSFGKGSVQQVICLDNTGLLSFNSSDSNCGGAELKVTIARWYTPDGKNIDKQGIKPEVKVTISDNDVKAGKDTQKIKAVQILQTKIGG